jgi:hypothetical protein
MWLSDAHEEPNSGAVGINYHVIFAASLGWDAQNKLSQK